MEAVAAAAGSPEILVKAYVAKMPAIPAVVAPLIICDVTFPTLAEGARLF